MKNSTTTLHQSKSDALKTKNQRGYNEIVEFLDAHWHTNKKDLSLSGLTQLDAALGSPSKKVATILIGGTNGKSLTINFTTKLLREEKLSVATCIAPHTLTYNERFCLNEETISNKTFAEIGNDVVSVMESLGLSLNTLEILTLMGLLHAVKNNADVILLEEHTIDDLPKTTHLCSPNIVGITRIAEGASPAENKASEEDIRHMLSLVKANSHVVSADQSKLNLQIMQRVVEEKNAVWSMPIRKLSALPYPFEQLHGRCAALAERIATIFINEFVNQTSVTVVESLLTKIKGQRGRPTLEAKRKSEMNPKKTVDQFWKDVSIDMPGRFQLLSKEKPSVLLDNAANLDALRNVLLGIRLLHYQRPLKGLTIILGNNNPDLDTVELLKLLRYFFKKTSGQIVLCPVKPAASNVVGHIWNVEALTSELKNMKIKARSADDLQQAFEYATTSVDERNGLIVITGAQELITEYWRHKGIKKI